MTDTVHRYVPEHEPHYWMPIPSPENRRHAFRGRRWDGRASGETVCGVTVPMARPDEMDWIMIGTCGDCWLALITEQGREGASPWRTSERDREIARESLRKQDG